MPGFTSHYIIGQKAFSDLPECRLKQIISKHTAVFHLGVQGPDIFFYNVFLARHKSAKNVGILMHEFHVNEFFDNALIHISNIKNEDDFDTAVAYIAGYMCHYVSDSIIHPYIYARIGYKPHQSRRERSIANSLHCQLENDIDAILLLRYNNKRPSEFKQHETFTISKSEENHLAAFLCSAINDTYFSERFGNTYCITNGIIKRSIWAMKMGCKTLQDPRESKRRKINYIENLINASPIVSNKLITNNIADLKQAMNMDHELWRNPWDTSLISDASLPELFLKTVRKLNESLYLLNYYIEENDFLPQNKKKLLDVLGNYSFHSGLFAG